MEESNYYGIGPATPAVLLLPRSRRKALQAQNYPIILGYQRNIEHARPTECYASTVLMRRDTVK